MDDGGSPRKNQHFSKRVKAFFGGKDKTLADVTEEEIISMVHEGHEQGVLQAQEVEMIHNIFEFGDKEAKDIIKQKKDRFYYLFISLSLYKFHLLFQNYKPLPDD